MTFLEVFRGTQLRTACKWEHSGKWLSFYNPTQCSQKQRLDVTFRPQTTVLRQQEYELYFWQITFTPLLLPAPPDWEGGGRTGCHVCWDEEGQWQGLPHLCEKSHVLQLAKAWLTRLSPLNKSQLPSLLWASSWVGSSTFVSTLKIGTF